MANENMTALENNKLEETVKWMHDLIWQMVREREDENVEFEL